MKDNLLELFDVVDEHNQVIRQAPRGEVHRLGLLHRAVHILVTNTQGYVFLQKRSRYKDVHPGCWDSSASGHLDAGEDYDASAIRETREEIGLHLTKCPEKLAFFPACPETGQEFVWVYHVQHDGPFQLLAREIDAGGWFEPAVITHWMAECPSEFASGFAYLWPKVVHRL